VDWGNVLEKQSVLQPTADFTLIQSIPVSTATTEAEFGVKIRPCESNNK